jgi:hypothetical protein
MGRRRVTRVAIRFRNVPAHRGARNAALVAQAARTQVTPSMRHYRRVGPTRFDRVTRNAVRLIVVIANGRNGATRVALQAISVAA